MLECVARSHGGQESAQHTRQEVVLLTAGPGNVKTWDGGKRKIHGMLYRNKCEPTFKWKWRDIHPSLVNRTRKSCSAFNPFKVYTHSSAHTHSEHTHTHTHTHTPWTHTRSSGQPGEQFGVRCLAQGYWGWRESCTFTPPTYNSSRPETRTRNLWLTSPTL